MPDSSTAMDLKDKYKTLFVIHSCSLRDFMNDHRLELAPSNAFFQLNRPVSVESFRDIIARKRSNGSFLTKADFTPIVGSTESEELSLSSIHLADFDVFVQCSSYNQLLNGGTEFLYQEEEKMDDSDSASTDVNKNGVPSLHASPVKVPTRLVGPPGSEGHDMVICFDTTGSMGACIAEVSKQASDVFRSLFNDYPNLQISPFAHGDYIDRFKYVTTFIDFTQNASSIKEWMDGVETTYGGDWEECYELALHEIRTQLSWRPNTKRSLIMIGDAIPHEPNVSEAKLDWEAELDAIVNDLGVRVYAVQCGSNALAKDFWQELAFRSGGKHLSLDNFSDTVDMITAICHREHNIDKVLEFANDIRQRDKAKGLTEPKENLFAIFDKLSVPDDPPSALKEDSVVGKTVDFTQVRRRLLEIEEAKKVEAEKVALKEREEKDALDSEKEEAVDSNSPKKNLTKKSDDEKPKKVVNRKRKADGEEKSPPKKRANQALDGQRKKLVSKSKKLVSEKMKASLKQTPVKKIAKKAAVQTEKKKVVKPAVKKTAPVKGIVKPAKAVKKATPVKGIIKPAKVVKKAGKEGVKPAKAVKKVVSGKETVKPAVKKSVPVVKKAVVKKAITKKPLKMSKDKIVKQAIDAKKKAVLKKITAKIIKKTPQKTPKKEKNAKPTPLKKNVEKKQAKKVENGKKAPTKVNKKPIENAKKTKAAIKAKTVKEKPVKKAAPTKKEPAQNKKAVKNVNKTPPPPAVTTVSTSKRRAAQNASCVWESLTKSPKKTNVSPVVNGKADSKKKPATKKK